MANCTICNDTGEVGGMGFLDCLCEAATDRAAMNEFAEAAARTMIPEELHWAIHQRAIALADERHAKEIADLVEQLHKMWGWAIEVGATPEYWERLPEDADGKREWQDDIYAAQQMFLRYRKKPVAQG